MARPLNLPGDMFTTYHSSPPHRLPLILLATLLGCSGGTVDYGQTGKELGVNLEGVSDWGRSWMFADAMKHARKWGSVFTPWDELSPVDAQGWPTRDAAIVVMAGEIPADIAGTYKLSFLGNAQVAPIASNFTVVNQVYDAATNTTTADLVVDDTLNQIMISFVGQPGGVKNVRLMRPGHTDADQFTRQFLKLLKPFTVLRFMDYSNTNYNLERTWSDRLLPTYATQQRPRQGASWEYAIDLCNTAGKDAWINVPDQADDNYVRNLATLLRDRLRPDLKIYVEWSNEVWNDMFGQTQRNYAATRAELAAGGSNLNADGETNFYYLAWRRTARRVKELSDIFRDVFGDGAMMTRVRPVLASQLYRMVVLTQGLEFIERQYGPPSRYFYAASETNYFSIASENRTDLTVDQIFAELPAGLRAEQDQEMYFGSFCRYYKLKNIAYEAGPAFVGAESLDAKIAANRDDRMKNTLIDSINNWYAIGGELSMHYNLASPYSLFGSWGLVERLGTETPKFAAIETVLAQPRPPLSAGISIPGTLSYSQAVASGGGFVREAEDYFGMGVGNWINFMLRVPANGNYRIRARARGDAGSTLKALLNSDQVATWDVANTTFSDLPWVSVSLEEGLNVIRMTPAAGGVDFNSITVEAAPRQ